MRIGVLTGGGDCPGLNAVIRAVVRKSDTLSSRVIGLRNGWKGLLDPSTMDLDGKMVSGILHVGGTIIGTSRTNPFKDPGGAEKAMRNMRILGLEALIAIGGEDTLGAAAKLHELGLPVVGVPKTIDNDIYGTDYSIGFDTAVNTALQAIDRIRDTASSLERIFFIEVMGRTAGFIGLDVGLASGAEEVLIPETPTDIRQLSRRLLRNIKKGKKTNIVVVSEGDEAGSALEIARKVKKLTGEDNRVAVLGYIQRGGAPSARDRILASQLGYEAVQALRRGLSGVMVGEMNGKTVFTKFRATYRRKKKIDLHLYKTITILAD